jgi:hypothetical protein
MNSNYEKIVTRDEMTNLNFALAYPHQFRYYRSHLLEDNIDRIKETLPTLTDKQRENIVAMLNVDLVVNTVMYCEDLAIMLLALDKPVTKMIKTFASLHETGAGSVKEFYEKIPKRDFDYFWHIIKYDKFYEEDSKYQRSCRRFVNDIIKVSKFFLVWYPLFSAFKHGLNVLACVNNKSGKDVIMIGERDGTFITTVLASSWSISYIEIIEIIHRIFDKIVDPITWVILEEVSGVNLEEKVDIKKKMESKEPMDKSRPVKLSLQIEFPWKIREAKKYAPFY